MARPSAVFPANSTSVNTKQPLLKVQGPTSRLAKMTLSARIRMKIRGQKETKLFTWLGEPLGAIRKERLRNDRSYYR